MKRMRSASSSVAAGGLTALPDGVISNVLAFLFSPDDVRATNWSRSHPSLEPHVVEFASVCKAWHALLDEVFSANRLSVFTFALSRPTRQSVIDLRRRLTLRRAHTQRVNLECATNIESMDGIMLWRAALSHAPRTTLVDVTTFTAEMRSHPTQFILAAGWSLPHVHTLYMPKYEMATARGMDPMTTTILKALELWFTHGRHGGLRVLRASFDEVMNDYERAKQVFETLARFCPKIERLESRGELTGAFASQWKLGFDAWACFFQSCTSLTDFDFGHVPFATLFFHAFGQNVQPKLTTLTLSASTKWDWHSYLREATPTHRTLMESRGFRGATADLSPVLKVCPNLRDLRVEWQFCSPRDTPKMNPEVFGDDFHEQLVTSCQDLERFTSYGVYTGFQRRPMIESFTDRSINALAKLPRLKFVEMSAKNITGNAVFDLVVKPRVQSTWMKREYRILVGDSIPREYSRESTTVVPFYHILLRFLERLAAEDDPTAVESRPVSLWLVNHSEMTAGKTWYEAYLAQLKALVARIKQKMPSVFMEISLVDEEGSWSHQIASFGFHTPRGNSDAWEKSSFLDRDGLYDHERIDSVFVRRYMRPLSDEESAEEESLDEEVSSGDELDDSHNDEGEDDDDNDAGNGIED